MKKYLLYHTDDHGAARIGREHSVVAGDEAEAVEQFAARHPSAEGTHIWVRQGWLGAAALYPNPRRSTAPAFDLQPMATA